MRKSGELFGWYWNIHIYKSSWFGLGISMNGGKYKDVFDEVESFDFSLRFHILFWKISLYAVKL